MNLKLFTKGTKRTYITLPIPPKDTFSVPSYLFMEPDLPCLLFNLCKVDMAKMFKTV